jgi:glycosyltransferase involved in cell wall biosynthesis
MAVKLFSPDLDPPFFSIVVPTYNRPQSLQNCLEALTRLIYSRDRFEVIVVDDGSSVALELIIAQFKPRLNLTLLRQQNAGPATARNTGAAQAKGQFIAFVDDDCLPTTTWLTVLAQQFAKMPNCLVGGYTVNQLPNNLYSTAHQILVDYFYSYYNAEPHQARFLTSNNIALPAQQFRQMGGFDTSFPLAAGEDREFCDRWMQCGYSMRYVFDAQIYHAHALTFSRFWQQHFNYGQGAFHFRSIRAERNKEQIKLEPWSFYMNLLRYPLTYPTSQPKVLIAGLCLMSQVANAAGFLWRRFQVQPQEMYVK